MEGNHWKKGFQMRIQFGCLPLNSHCTTFYLKRLQLRVFGIDRNISEHEKSNLGFLDF